MLEVLRHRPTFRRLFLAHAISRAGDAFNTVALVVLVFRLTGSGLGVAATVVFEILPVLLIGPLGGLIADRYPRRTVMVSADVLRALLVAALAVVHGSLALAFVVAFGISTGSVLFNPAASSLTPELVEDDELVTANAALWTVAVIAQIAFAPVAGLLIATIGVGPAFAINAASFVGSALLLRRLDAGTRPATIAARSWEAITAGAAVVRTHPLLRRLALAQLLAALSAGATSGLLVVLASDSLHVGPSGFGLLLGAIGIGAAAGPLLLSTRIRPNQRRWLFGPFAVRGAVDFVLAGVSSPVAAGGALALYGVGTSTGMIAYQSTLQSEAPTQTRGRVFALFDILWNGARLVSLGIGGVMADAIGVRSVYVLGGVLLSAAALGGAKRPGHRLE